MIHLCVAASNSKPVGTKKDNITTADYLIPQNRADKGQRLNPFDWLTPTSLCSVYAGAWCVSVMPRNGETPSKRGMIANRWVRSDLWHELIYRWLVSVAGERRLRVRCINILCEKISLEKNIDLLLHSCTLQTSRNAEETPAASCERERNTSISE